MAESTFEKTTTVCYRRTLREGEKKIYSIREAGGNVRQAVGNQIAQTNKVGGKAGVKRLKKSGEQPTVNMTNTREREGLMEKTRQEGRFRAVIERPARQEVKRGISKKAFASGNPFRTSSSKPHGISGKDRGGASGKKEPACAIIQAKLAI